MRFHRSPDYRTNLLRRLDEVGVGEVGVPCRRAMAPVSEQPADQRQALARHDGMTGHSLVLSALSGQGGMDAPRHPVGGVRYGLMGQMDVTLGGLDQGMAEQLGDGDYIDAVYGGDRSPVVAQVMNPQSLQTGFIADAVPLILEIVDMPCGRTGGKEEGAIGAVLRNGVDHRTGGAGEPDDAGTGFAVWLEARITWLFAGFPRGGPRFRGNDTLSQRLVRSITVMPAQAGIQIFVLRTCWAKDLEDLLFSSAPCYKDRPYRMVDRSRMRGD